MSTFQLRLASGSGGVWFKAASEDLRQITKGDTLDSIGGTRYFVICDTSGSN